MSSFERYFLHKNTLVRVILTLIFITYISISGSVNNGYSENNYQNTENYLDTSIVDSSSIEENSEYKVIKKDLDVDAQIAVGTGIMIFLVVIMSLVNNYNPK